MLHPDNGDKLLSGALNNARDVVDDSRGLPGFGYDADLNVNHDERCLISGADSGHGQDALMRGGGQAINLP
jgi:hypothetical protein